MNWPAPPGRARAPTQESLGLLPPPSPPRPKLGDGESVRF